MNDVLLNYYISLCVLALIVSLFASAGMLPLLAFVAGQKAKIAKRSAYDRLGRHILWIGLWFGAMACGAQAFCLYLTPPPLPDVLLDFGSFQSGLWICIAAGGMVLFSLLLLLARSVKDYGWIAIFSLFAVWAFILLNSALVVSWFGGGNSLESGPLTPRDWLFAALSGAQSYPKVFGCLATLTACLGLAVGGSVTLLSLLLRRKTDDFGRDYYRLAVNWSAGWGAWGGAGLAVLSGLGFWWLLPQASVGQAGILLWQIAAAVAACAVLTLLCLLSVARSDNPLRLKSLMFFSLLLMMICGPAMMEVLAGCFSALLWI